MKQVSFSIMASILFTDLSMECSLKVLVLLDMFSQEFLLSADPGREFRWLTPELVWLEFVILKNFNLETFRFLLFSNFYILVIFFRCIIFRVLDGSCASV